MIVLGIDSVWHSYTLTMQNIGLHQVQVLSVMMSVELTLNGVSCVLSWHILPEGQVHYQCGHRRLECVECRVC